MCEDMSNNEGKELTTYIVLKQMHGSDDVEVHEVHTTIYHLLDANQLKEVVFQQPQVHRCWVERMTQKRVGAVLEKPPQQAPFAATGGGKLIM